MASDPGKNQDQELLLPRVAAGDAGAVQACIDRYGALVWSIVRKSMRDTSQADDAVQEIFVSLWRAASRFDPKMGSESVFIATIARRRLIDRHRRLQRVPEAEPIDEVVVADSRSDTETVDREDEAHRAFAALEHLKPQQKRLLELWVVGGMSHSEIAASTGVPLGTVKSQIRRGLIRVRELLQDRVTTPTEASA